MNQETMNWKISQNNEHEEGMGEGNTKIQKKNLDTLEVRRQESKEEQRIAVVFGGLVSQASEIK